MTETDPRPPAPSSPDEVTRRSAVPESPDTRTLERRLVYVVAGRLATASLLIGGVLFLAPPVGSFFATAVRALIAMAFGVSLLSLVLLSRVPARALSRAQLAFDVTLVTGLVYLTGGISSVFSFLYGAVVLVAAFVGTVRTTSTVAGSALSIFVCLGIGMANGWIPGPVGQNPAAYTPSAAELANALLRNVVGLVVIGGLATSLVDRLRRTTGDLERAKESARSYARLTEDIVRSISSGLVTVDHEGTVRSANPAALILFRATERDLVGAPLARFFPELATETLHVRSEGAGHRPDGTTFPVGFTRMPLRSNDGRESGALVAFQDLTEITQLRRKAQQTERLAVLGGLAAGVAHEIRNPLGSISGSVELVRDGATLGDEDRRLLDMVLKEVERLNELVTSMLEVGRGGDDRAPTDLTPIVAEVVEVARRGAPDTPIELSTEGPAIAVARGPQMRQVLWNLLRNAIQFSPAGAPVTVSIASTDGEVRIAVRDRGPGIAEADRAHVFDVHFTRRRHGFGLGLALVKQIVDLHEGSIEVESAPGAGSNFVVTIPSPLSRNAEPSAPPDTSEAPSPNPR